MEILQTEREKEAMFTATSARVLSLLVAIYCIALFKRHLGKHHTQFNDNFSFSFLLNDKEYIALVVDCTICGFFRYFRSNKPEGGRTIARTNLTKNEFL